MSGSLKLEPTQELVDSRTDKNSIAENEVYKFNIPEIIPPRKFIYKRWYIKGFVTGTAATGGTGKTTVMDVEAVSMAIGKDLFLKDRNPLKKGPIKVLVFSLEDDTHEFYRRYKAIIAHYNIQGEDLELIKKNITPVFGSDKSIKIASRGHSGVELDQDAILFIKEMVKGTGAEAVTIDPLVSIHAIDENNNIEMQQVLHVLRSIAREFDCAIHFAHHNRKGGDSSADSMRGAVSLRDGSRRLRMLSRPSKEDLKGMSVEEDERKRLIAEMDGKNNFGVMGDTSTFYITQGICLSNGTDDYDDDWVGVAETYQPKSLLDSFTLQQVHSIWKELSELPDDKRRTHHNTGEGYIGAAIASIADVEKKQARYLLNAWEESGVLVKDSYRHDSKDKPFYKVVIPQVT